MTSMAGSLVSMLFLISSLLLPTTPVGPAVPAQQLFKYVPSKAQIVFHVDVRSIKSQLGKSIQDLYKQPFVTKEPLMKGIVDRLHRMVKQSIRRIERTAMLKKLGQIHFITFALRMRGMSRPHILITVHGDLSLESLERLLLPQAPKKKSAHGFTFFFGSSPYKPSFAWTPTGQILIGTPPWLRALARTGAQTVASKSLRESLIKHYKPNHIIAFAGRLTNHTRERLRRISPLFHSLAEDLSHVYGAMWGKSSLVKVTTPTTQSIRRFKLLLEGMGQLGVSGDYFRRGLLSIVDGVLTAPSGQKNKHPILSMLMAHKGSLFSYLRSQFSQLSYKVTTQSKTATLAFSGNGGALLPLLSMLGAGSFFTLRANQKAVVSRKRYPRKRSKSTTVRGFSPPLKKAARVAPLKKSVVRQFPPKKSAREFPVKGFSPPLKKAARAALKKKSVQPAQTPFKKPAKRKANRTSTRKTAEPTPVPIKQVAKRRASQPIARMGKAKRTRESYLTAMIKRGSVRVCVRSDLPPFGFFAGNSLRGFDIELAGHIVNRLSLRFRKNLHLTWVIVAASERISGLLNKKCDLAIAAFSKTASRAKKIKFSDSYSFTQKILLARQRALRVKGAILAVVRGTTGSTRAIPGTKPAYFHDYNEVLDAMRLEKIDYVMTDHPTGLFLVRKSRNRYTIHKILSQKEAYSIGMHPGHHKLHRAVDSILFDIRRAGFLSLLHQKWVRK